MTYSEDRTHHTSGEPMGRIGGEGDSDIDALAATFRKPTNDEIARGPGSDAWAEYMRQRRAHEEALRRQAEMLDQKRSAERRVEQVTKRKRLATKLAAGVLVLSAGGLGAHTAMERGGMVDHVLAGRIDVSAEVEQAAQGESPEAIASVVRTLEDVKSGNWTDIDRRAKEFSRENRDQFVDAKTKDEVLAAVDAAASPSEVLAALKPYSDVYHVPFAIDDEANQSQEFLGTLKDTVRQMIDAYQFVPKNIFSSAEYHSITFYERGALGKSPSTGDEIIGQNSTVTRDGEALYNNMNLPVGDKDSKNTFLHELGHALSRMSRIAPDDHSYEKSANIYSEVSRGIKNDILGVPQEISEYGKTDYKENAAEYFMYVLGGKLAIDPENAREFISKRGEEINGLLVSLESLQAPNHYGKSGYTDFLLSGTSTTH